MHMDSHFTRFSGSMNGVKFQDNIFFPDSDHYSNFTNEYKLKDPSLGVDFNFTDNPLVIPDPYPSNSALSTTGSDGESPSDDNDFSDTILQCISQMLMEEEMEEKPCVFHDPLALQDAEKSLYDALGEKHPSSPNHSLSYGDQFLVDSPDDGFSSGLSDYSSNSSYNSNTGSSSDPQWSGEYVETRPSFMQIPLPSNFVFQSTATSCSQSSLKLQNVFASNGSGVSNIVVPNFFNESELALQFRRGVEEANKFLPKNSQLVGDLETKALSSELKEKGIPPVVVVKAEKEERDYSLNWYTGKKNHGREDEDFEEERSNKQSAVFVDETELAEMFDRVLVCCGDRGRPPQCGPDEAPQNGSSKIVQAQQNGQTNGSVGGKNRAKRQTNKKEVVDLRTLLILCAQAVSADDRRTANELLKQIRQHSSPFGEGVQRLAHWFADGLEARLAGTGTQIYTALSAEKTSARDMLKAYTEYIKSCPFQRMAIIFANHNILHAAEGATTLHVIDFGILYGFQWPALIFRLSKRPGGPPKLRITGIELPQSGFRPAERVQQTGRRLAKYCELHNVPFEYNAISQKWETIKIDDLRIKPGEVLAVNCLFRFKNLLDETVVVNSPRNAVLNLIRRANPDLFVHAIVNGSYNAPFFVTRFREALFHFSALFDMFDTNMPREDPMRLKFEKELYGREAMNVIACEGMARVERPETYKQWQVRSMRAGLKQLPLDPLAMKKLKGKVKTGYHSDFVVDQDGDWMLQGWKGRIVYASSVWVAAQDASRGSTQHSLW